MKIDNVIVATDLSELAGSAARWGVTLAELYGAALSTAHVIELSIPNWFRGLYDIDEDPTKRAKVEARVSDWFQEHTGRAVDTHHIAVGDSSRRLTAIAESVENPLLVLTCSGNDAIEKFFVGSTAQAIVAQSPCPIFAIDINHVDPDVAGDVAVATDLTTISDNAIVAAAAYARQRGRSLHVIHTSSIAHLSKKTDYFKDLSEEEITSGATEAFDKVIARHDETLKGLDVKAHLLHERPVQGLVSFAEQVDLSVLFIGHMDRESKIENLFGRTSVRLMQAVPTSLCIVPGIFVEG